ncbi:MAG: FHA domain-containing protein [bacterium]
MATLIHYHNNVVINKFSIKKQSLKIGSNVHDDVYIEDNDVSEDCALIETVENPSRKDRKEYYIIDLESMNRIYVNGKKIKRHKLHNNDLLRIGIDEFKFIDRRKNKPKKKPEKIDDAWFPRVFYSG